MYYVCILILVSSDQLNCRAQPLDLRILHLPFQLEFCLLTVNTDKETAQLSLLGPSILALLEKKEHEDPK